MSRGSRHSSDAVSELAKKVREYTVGEEVASATTHGIGAALGIVALTLLVVYSLPSGDPLTIAAAIVYGVSIILEFAASTLYHALPYPRAKHIFKILDHASIYLLIAGTYTPFCLITLRDSGGVWMAVVIWAIALVGIAAEAAWVFRPRWVSAVLYLAMGWLVVFRIEALTAALSGPGLWLLIGGGLAYTVGTVFYVLKKIKYMHAIWHLWVLLGAILHFLAVVMYVI